MYTVKLTFRTIATRFQNDFKEGMRYGLENYQYRYTEEASNAVGAIAKGLQDLKLYMVNQNSALQLNDVITIVRNAIAGTEVEGKERVYEENEQTTRRKGKGKKIYCSEEMGWKEDTRSKTGCKKGVSTDENVERDEEPATISEWHSDTQKWLKAATKFETSKEKNISDLTMLNMKIAKSLASEDLPIPLSGCINSTGISQKNRFVGPQVATDHEDGYNPFETKRCASVPFRIVKKIDEDGSSARILRSLDGTYSEKVRCLEEKKKEVLDELLIALCAAAQLNTGKTLNVLDNEHVLPRGDQ
ncbi:hypothetical protein BDQ17DRAFT_1331908 [Cyathus striatus]|nr:hypothetical protein BDQ17DRAFT_1331908 [Cyathus striatus]